MKVVVIASAEKRIGQCKETKSMFDIRKQALNGPIRKSKKYILKPSDTWIEIMRRAETIVLFLLISLLLAFPGPANAGDAEDCAGNTPAVSISACTRIIEQARVPNNQIADAFANRGKAYLTTFRTSWTDFMFRTSWTNVL